MNALPLLTPFDAATMIQSLDERGRGVRVGFFRPTGAAERWGHVVASVEPGPGGERVTPRLVSQEGAGPDGWPLSPPLQSLAIEERPGGAVALLVGMSGQSHWSASVESLADRRLKIDIACRLGTGASRWRLGSSYQTNVPGRVSGDVLELDAESGSSCHLLLRFGPEMRLEMSSGSIDLQVKETTQRPIRWQYEIEYCG